MKKINFIYHTTNLDAHEMSDLIPKDLIGLI